MWQGGQEQAQHVEEIHSLSTHFSCNQYVLNEQAENRRIHFPAQKGLHRKDDLWETPQEEASYFSFLEPRSPSLRPAQARAAQGCRTLRTDLPKGLVHVAL